MDDQEKRKVRERRKKQDYALKIRPSIGKQKGLYRSDPPDWKGRLPAFETEEQKKERLASNPRINSVSDDGDNITLASSPSGNSSMSLATAPATNGNSTSSSTTTPSAPLQQPQKASDTHMGENITVRAQEPPAGKRPRTKKDFSLKTRPTIGAHKGMYRQDPPDWKGKFPAFAQQLENQRLQIEREKALEKASAERKKIFPFLELPTELRAEIYSLLLGGRTIHIDYPGCKDVKRFIDGRPFLCQASITDKEAFEQHGWQPKPPPARLYFTIRHSKCTGSIAEALPLKIIGLNKQIYKEASLVPFQENVFTFSAPQSIKNFLLRLNPLQQAALTHVAVFQTTTGTMWDSPRLSEPLELPPYLNIKRLTVFIELCPANLNPKDGKASIMSVVVQDRLVSRMGVLWSAKLERVEVLINNIGVAVGDEYKCLSVEDVEAWTKRIKVNLLPTREKVEDEEEEEEDAEAKMDRELEELEGDEE